VTRVAGAVLAVATCVVLTGCGGSSTPKAAPGPFAITIVQRITHNDYTHVWADLLSVDRQVAPKTEYVACESKHPVGAVPRSVKVLHVTDESVGLGNGTFVNSKAVSLRITFAGNLALTHVVHLVAESGHWRFILPPWRYRDYKADKCPSTEAESSAA
jgi:hypothetical protein